MASELLGSSQLDERLIAKAALDAAEEQLQTLCASHAGTFVSVERRARAMEQALKDLQATIKDVEVKVVEAQKTLEQDEDKESSLAALAENHRVRRRTLLQHSSLLELLELPSLMDACVRSSLYEDALSIAAFSNTLERRHKDSNTVVTRVIVQIRSRQGDLRRHLLHRLKSPVTMPQCLEVVTALRRLNSIDLERQQNSNLERVHAAMEMRLQVDFLENRDAWLDVTTAPASSRPSVALPSASEHLLDAIERYRTRVFEVATQFNAIFRADSSHTESTVSLLGMWMARRIHAFLNLLTTHLASTEDSAQVRDALEASVFFASSMGRLGADFTAQLVPIFETRMHAIVTKPWRDGSAQLKETLNICANAGIAAPLVSHAAVENAADAQLAGDVPLEDPQPPPRLLMEVPPLARFVNAILTGLNELRRCMLPGIVSMLRASLSECIKQTQQDLAANERVVMTPGFKGEAAALREAATRFKTLYADIVEPYIRGSLEASIGNKDGANRYHMVLYENLKEPDTETIPDLEPENFVEESESQAGEADLMPKTISPPITDGQSMDE
ncbi:hypothetical protein MPSEU_000949000 [Mayamaea pseudoterrestris]|nr:hypothetical protein MPSEU_000949000 [Mayamaea pseudoterrestris]